MFKPEDIDQGAGFAAANCSASIRLAYVAICMGSTTPSATIVNACTQVLAFTAVRVMRRQVADEAIGRH